MKMEKFKELTCNLVNKAIDVMQKTSAYVILEMRSPNAFIVMIYDDGFDANSFFDGYYRIEAHKSLERYAGNNYEKAMQHFNKLLKREEE